MLSDLQENTNRQSNKISKAIHEQNEKFIENTKTIKENQVEILKLKNSMTELEYSIESANSRADQVEVIINKLKAKSFEITQSEEQKEKIMKNSEEIYRILLDTIKLIHIHILRAPKGEKQKKKGGAKPLFKEIMVENSPNLQSKMSIQNPEAPKISNRFL